MAVGHVGWLNELNFESMFKHEDKLDGVLLWALRIYHLKSWGTLWRGHNQILSTHRILRPDTIYSAQLQKSCRSNDSVFNLFSWQTQQQSYV